MKLFMEIPLRKGAKLTMDFFKEPVGSSMPEMSFDLSDQIVGLGGKKGHKAYTNITVHDAIKIRDRLNSFIDSVLMEDY